MELVGAQFQPSVPLFGGQFRLVGSVADADDYFIARVVGNAGPFS